MVRSAVLLFGMMCVASCGPKGNVAPDRPTENEQIPPVLPTVTVEEELKRLEGEWKLVKAEPGELKQTGRAVFKDDTVSFREDWAPQKIKLDPTKDPKRIDIRVEYYKTDLPGIYKIEGDRLTLYLINTIHSGKAPERPKGFDVKAEGQITHYERVKKQS